MTDADLQHGLLHTHATESCPACVQDVTIDGPSLSCMASYSEATCMAGVLLWRLPFANDTFGADDLSVGLSLQGLQLPLFDVTVWQLDEGHQPEVRINNPIWTVRLQV